MSCMWRRFLIFLLFIMPRKSASMKTQIKEVKNLSPVDIFYLTLYFQMPQCQMAENYLKKLGLSQTKLKSLYKSIKKK